VALGLTGSGEPTPTVAEMDEVALWAYDGVEGVAIVNIDDEDTHEDRVPRHGWTPRFWTDPRRYA